MDGDVVHASMSVAATTVLIFIIFFGLGSLLRSPWELVFQNSVLFLASLFLLLRLLEWFCGFGHFRFPFFQQIAHGLQELGF